MSEPASPARSSAREWLVALALYSALALALTSRGVFGDGDFYLGDVLIFERPRDLFLARALREEGTFPRWIPGIYGGAPALGAQELALFYPPTLLLALVAPERARVLGFALHLVLAALGARALARRLGAGASAALVAGLVYGFSGCALTSVAVPVYTRSLAWLPWAVLGIVRAVTDVARATAVAGSPDVARATSPAGGLRLDGRGLALAIGPFLATYLGGDPFGCVVSAVASLAIVVATREVPGSLASRTGRGLAALALAALATVLLASAQLWPALEALPESARRAGSTFAVASRWSLWPFELPGLAVPFLFGAHAQPTSVWIDAVSPDHERAWFEAIYLGPIALALAFAGARDRRGLARGALALAVLFLPLALGRSTPLYRLFYALPPGKLFDFPAKLFVPVVLGLSLVAAGGVQSLLEGDARARKWALAVLGVLSGLAFVASGAAGALAESLGASIDAFGVKSVTGKLAVQALAPRLAHVGVVALGGLAVIGLGAGEGTKRRRLGAALVALVALDLGIALREALIFAPREALAAVPAAAILEPISKREGGVPVRVFPTHASREDPAGDYRLAPLGSTNAILDGLTPDVGLGEGVLSQAGFLSSPPLRPIAIDLATRRLREKGAIGLSREAVLAGARYAVATEAEAPALESEGAITVATWGRRVLVSLPGAPPWAGLYGRARHVADWHRALDEVSSRDFDPTREVVLERDSDGTIPDEPFEGGRVTLASRFGCHELALDVDSPRPAWLVVRETYSSGWRATVGGWSVPVVPADVQFRAVAVPAGKSRVVFSYETLAPAGAFASAVSFVLLVGLGLARRRRP